MNKFLVLKDYASKPAGTAIATNQDMTLAANELMNASGAFIGFDSQLKTSVAGNKLAFMYKNIKGVSEGLIVIEKPVSVIRITPVSAVKKVGVWTLSDNVEALAVGQTFTLIITDLTKDVYDPKRNISYSYTLTTLDNLTTASNASYYIKRMATDFNAKHSAFGTMAYVSAETFQITPVATIDFTVSSGGIFPTVVETPGGTGTAVAYVAPIGTASQIEAEEKWYSTERGNSNNGSLQTSDLYTVGSAVIEGKTYVQYVMTWSSLSTEHPLGAGTTAVHRTLVLAIPSDATNIATLNTAMDGLFGTSFS